jgi:hypothetical protein
MKINFNRELTDLDGQPVKDGEQTVTIGKIVAQHLRNVKTFPDVFKLMETWAIPMYRGEDIHFDTSDLQQFKDLINASDMFPMVKYQTLKIIKEHEMSR